MVATTAKSIAPVVILGPIKPSYLPVLSAST